MAFDFLGIAPYRFCMAMRNIALMTMIGLALARIAGGTYTPSTEIVWANVGQISTVYVNHMLGLLVVSIFSFIRFQ
jgi:hypothetical protein